MKVFKLNVEPPIPVAYIDIEDERHVGDSAEQRIVDISGLQFTPQELIFDIAEDGTILGVELI